jgi:hypothetical protein
VLHAYLINPTIESAPSTSGRDVLGDGSKTTAALNEIFSNSLEGVFIADAIPWRLPYRDFEQGEKSRPRNDVPDLYNLCVGNYIPACLKQGGEVIILFGNEVYEAFLDSGIFNTVHLDLTSLPCVRLPFRVELWSHQGHPVQITYS